MCFRDGRSESGESSPVVKPCDEARESGTRRIQCCFALIEGPPSSLATAFCRALALTRTGNRHAWWFPAPGSAFALGYLARAEPEERHVGSMIRRPQAHKRSYGSTREIGRVRLCGFLVRLGRHGNCWPTAAVRSHADVLPYECLHLVAAKQRIAHGTDEAMSSSPRVLG